MKNKLLKDVLKPLANADSLSIVSHLYEHEEAFYDGVEFVFEGKELSGKIEKLIENKIIDYDVFTETLSLEYQSDDFFRYLMEANTETSIEDVKKKIKLIEQNLSNINLRKKNFEAFDKEAKNIQKAIRSVPNIIERNAKILNSGSLFAYKIEKNQDIKIEYLEVCKTQIDDLSRALEQFTKFINKRSNNKTFVELLPNPLLLDSVRNNLMGHRKIILHTRMSIIDYLARTLKDGEFLKKLNTIGSIIKNGKIFSETNILETIEQKELLPRHRDIKKKIDFDVGDFQESLESEYIKSNVPKVKQENTTYEPIDRKKHKQINELKLIRPYDIYKKLIQQSNEMDLATLIYTVTKDRKKVSLLISSIVIKWHYNLSIEPKKSVIIENYKYPIINRR